MDLIYIDFIIDQSCETCLSCSRYDENILDFVDTGAEFEKVGTVEGWVKIKYYDGSVAFIKAEFVEEFTK